ncbi:MAG: RsmB/NOP family class I SAM-dependent RNA methyltransferase [Kineosporiaceae bacterium]
MTERPRSTPASRRPAGGNRTSRVVDQARAAALEASSALDERDAYVNLVLPAVLRRRRLSGRDAAFATELTYGSVRGRGTYDPILAHAAGRPLAEISPPLLVDALRLGAHQVLAMRVPPHAAVSATVDLVSQAVGAGPARLANAVLRRVAERDLDAWLELVAPPADTDPDGHLAVATSHPAWVVRALRDGLAAHGRPVTELPDLLAADNAAPAVSLAVLPGLGDAEAARAAGGRPGRMSPLALLAGGAPHDVPGVRQGTIRVQDEGSQAVALALAAAELDGPDAGRWLDLCAGPGGKAALLAALQQERRREGVLGEGAHLDAVEVSPHRAGLVRSALRPLPSSAWTVHEGDGRELAEELASHCPGGGFDRVLLDAPCTGLGALRRRPEARWRREPGDVGDLAQLQRALLRAALEAARPGGVVAYVTCSPHRAETSLVVDDVLRRRPADARPVRKLDAAAVSRAALGREDLDLGSGPDVQWWPHLHGCDAMFLSLLKVGAHE